MSIQVVILAAGKSSRFSSTTTKLIQKVGSVEMINRVVGAANELNLPCTVVVGHLKNLIKTCIERTFPSYVQYAEQTAQLGTGDAFFSAKKFLSEKTILVTNGDSPCISATLLSQFYNFFEKEKLDVACVSATTENPFGYGRLVPNQTGFLIKEEKTLTNAEKQINLINGGVYAFSKEFLDQEFDLFMQAPTPGEINITDLYNQANFKSYRVGHFSVDFDLIRGVNDIVQLQEAIQIINSQ